MHPPHRPTHPPLPRASRPPPTSNAGASTSPTNAPKPPSIATSPADAPAKSGTSCSHSPMRKAATRHTGWSCSETGKANRSKATSAPGPSDSSHGVSVRSSCSPSRRGQKPAPPTHPTRTPRHPWQQTNRSTKKSCVPSLLAAATGSPERSARPSSERTTGSSATSRSSSVSARAASRPTSCCSPACPVSSPAHCRWGRANTCPYDHSVSCSTHPRRIRRPVPRCPTSTSTRTS